MAQIPNKYGDSKPAQDMKHEDTQGLVSFVMTRVDHARRVRDDEFGDRWKEYTRLWRGFWGKGDKNTDSERSKLIAPALQQAIEMTVSEMEEATFGRKAWFDISDDINDEDRDDATKYRDQLLEDFELFKVPREVAKTYLLGAIYGTGIAKINVELKKVGEIERPVVKVYAIRPDEFFIDPSATDIEEAQFCGHDILKPRHGVKSKIEAGLYKDYDVSAWTGERPGDATGGSGRSVQVEDDAVLITEYYGKIPGRYVGKKGMVEAIVVIGNETHCLKVMENPFDNQDRPVIAYQHDTVPGEFWGRGVAEKGYNPQKALDAELRARIDALALMTAPMLGADVTRLPRNPDMRTRPGKVFLTRGRPSEVIEPVGFANPSVLAATFQQSGDLERMVQMGTGAMDSATPVGTNRRNETASGMSMLNQAFIKRSKRTMQNVERDFLDPMITKSLWRYMQFYPTLYQKDMLFIVNSTMGIMAKEVEQAQLINLIGYVPPDSPSHKILLAAIFENTASADKKAIGDVIKQMLAPPSEEEKAAQQKQQQMQEQMQQIAIQTAQAELDKLKAETALEVEKAKHVAIKADLEDDMVEIQAANAATAAQKTRISAAQVQTNAQRNQVEREKAVLTARSKSNGQS